MSLKLHLACGNNIIDGWENLDGSAGPGKTLCDLTKPFPYRDASVDFIYSEHFIEHITREQAVSFFKECRRVLKQKGLLRISTPNLDVLIADYLDNKLDRWSSLGWNPATNTQLLNEGMRLWGHTFLYDWRELYYALHEAGFKPMVQQPYRVSCSPEMCDLESRPDCKDLIVETGYLGEQI